VNVRVAVIGGGSWGTTVAHLCAHNAATVLYARDPAVAAAVNSSGENPRYLPGRQLHPDLRATSDMAEAAAGAGAVVMAVPSHGFRETLSLLGPHIGERTPLVSLTKGLEARTCKRMTEVVADELPGRPAGVLTLIARIARLEPPQTRRDDVQQRFQQFSTPLELAWCVAACAGVTARDVVLEPSAGTGTLAAAAALGLDAANGGRLALNELTSTRAGLLHLAFPGAGVSRHDAEHIADLLPDLRPSVVVMNPPFSRSAGPSKPAVGADRPLSLIHI